jgi:hypothetical protein
MRRVPSFPPKGVILFTAARKLYGPTTVVLLSLVLSAGSAVAEIIPPDRIAPWQGNVGVPGGIPKRTIIYKNIVTDLGADPTGKVDAAPIIKRAILSCPVGQVVYMPAGTFKIATAIYAAAKSNFTLRGAGQGQTILRVTTNVVPIYSSGISVYPVPTTGPSITAGATKGSNTITVSDTSPFAVDTLFKIAVATPTWAHILGGFPDTNRRMGGMFKVRSKTDTTITFDPPLPFDFSGMDPLAVRNSPTTIQGVGYESFTVDQSAVTVNIWSIQISSAWGCWIKDVEFKNNKGRIIYMSNVARCELRESYTNGPAAVLPNHEGLDFGGNDSWCLVENNIVSPGGPPIVFGDGGGFCIGNVIAYNYITAVQPNSWDATFNHGPHNMLNLCEGNVFQNSFKDDGYFGSSSHNTLFRNVIQGQVSLKHFCNYYNVVGNILGKTTSPKLTRVYESEVSDYWNQHLYPIYELGFPNIGNSHYVGTFGPTTPPDYHTLPNTLDGCQQLDRNVKATIIRHGNYDYVNNTVVWDPAISDHTIPNSLYLAGKPAWWGDLPWPAIGPDLTPMVGMIPAQQRFANGMPAPAPTPGVTLESERTNLPSHGAPSATPESQPIDLPPHDGPSATPESQQKFQKKWTKNKKQKGTKTKKNPADETSETPGPGQP